MKLFNYNPFTWEPEIGEHYFGLNTGDGKISEFTYDSWSFQENHRESHGAYKTEQDAEIALEIAREAILKNVKE